ncbi:MAG: ABC transporter permease [Chloroflexi bacterium]|nr:ABC transporter permease [Chloroflexota bacterium]
MSILDVFITALTSMRSNILRTLLTMLGIIIGIAAVITGTAAGEGAQQGVTERIAGLGSNLMFVRPYSPDSGGVNLPGLGPSLFFEDSKQVVNAKLPCVSAIAAQATIGAPGDFIGAQAIYRGKNIDTLLVGTEPTYQQVRNFYVGSGRFITQDDVDKKALVVVLGSGVADKLFGSADPIGQNMRIFAGVGGRFGITINFTVIGVMEARGGSSGADEDNQIFTPLPSLQARAPAGFRNARGYSNIGQINVALAENCDEDAAKIDIAAILRKARELPPGKENDFQIQSQKDVLATATEVEESFQILIASIALIALVVGGIGIMNIMLVSVTERTREIGIRKAVGAKRFDILLQFLLEALVVTVLGGILGVLAAWGATKIAAGFDIGGKDTKYAITAQWVMLGLGVSAVTGVIAGVYPAWRAARLDPIEALRHE